MTRDQSHQLAVLIGYPRRQVPQADVEVGCLDAWDMAQPGESFTYDFKLCTLVLAHSRVRHVCAAGTRELFGQRIVEWGHCSPVVSSNFQLVETLSQAQRERRTSSC